MFRIYSQHKPGDLINRRYRLTGIIGEGALGRVFRAEDTKFNPPRQVAVKILHAALVRNEAARLEIRQEASTLAQLNHPGILTIYDYEVSRALTFLVMELATGGSLQDKLNAAGTLPYDQILRYLEVISPALDYAHAAGLLHRDIKPQNILLNAHGQPVLADFSLAVKLEGDANSLKVGEVWGTAEYAAPEVWRGEVERVSDIYALAVVLYQLCTGEPPYTGDLANLQWQHEHAAVPPLSKYLPRLSYPPGLDKLFADAMAKDPARRPASAHELYIRFKLALTDIPAPAPAAETPAEGEDKSLTAKRSIFSRVRDKIRSKTGELKPAAQPEIRMLPETLPQIEPTTNLTRLWSEPNPIASEIKGHTSWLRSVAFSPDGSLLVSAGDDQMARIWQVGETLSPLHLLSGHTGIVAHAAFSPGGRQIATCSWDKTLKIWDATTGQLQHTLETGNGGNGLAFSSRQQWLALASDSWDMWLYSTITWQPEKILRGHKARVESVAFGRDDQFIISGDLGGQIIIWSKEGKLLRQIAAHTDWLNEVAISPNNSHLLSCGQDGRVALWRVEDGQKIWEQMGEKAKGVAFAPDGSVVALAFENKKVEIRQTANGELLNTLEHRYESFRCVAFSPDGRRLVAGCYSGTLLDFKVS